MMKQYAHNNYKLLINKLKKINKLDFNKVLDNLKENVICIGSGSSYTTAYLSSLILEKYYNKNSKVMTPRELLNKDIKDDISILIYSYSGTSKDTEYLKNNYKNVTIITGRNIEEFKNKDNIFSYYLEEEYERGLILYENIIIPISILINTIDELKDIITYEIDNFNKYKIDINNCNNIAIFTGDYTTPAILDLTDKILETGITKIDVYDKKNFSHGQYNYFMNNKYTNVIYYRQKKISKYEELLIDKLKEYDPLIIKSEFNDIKASYDLIFKSFILFNKLLDNKELKLYDDEFKELYKYEGDFK